MHRSLPKFGLPVPIAVLLFTASCLADPDQGPSCDDLPTLPPTEDRCAFVRAHCNDEGLLPLLSLYFCHLRPHGKIIGALFLTCSAAILIVLFKCMGHAADEYFSSILSQISQDMGLPPRLGGVTLLALGNGAPDLSSAIAAVRSGNYPLALGALTGGTLFVGCVVAGRIVTVSGGVRSRGAQIRDVLTQFIAIAVVTITIATGKVTYGAIAGLLSLYVIYVIVVAVADFTKRAGVEWGDIGVRLSKHVSMRIRQNGLIAPLLHRSGSGGGGGENFDGASVERPFTNEDGLGYYYGSSNGRYLDTQETMGLGEVESEVSEDVLPTVTLVPPATATPSVENTSRNENHKLGLGDSLSNGLRKSHASEVELTVSPPISRQRSPIRGAQSFPAPFDAPADSATRGGATRGGSGGGGGGGDAAGSHPTRRSQTLGYGELLHMPAKEYRQRALADMAAAVSFYKDRGAAAEAVAELEALDESEEEDEEGGVMRDEERGEYTPPEIPPLDSNDDTQQNVSSPPAPLPAEASAPDGSRAASAPAALSLPPAPSLPHSIKSSGGQYGSASPPWMIIEEGEETTKFDQRLASLGQALESAATPVMFLLKSTIPIVEMTSYNKFWFLIAMAASPLFICIYFGALPSSFRILVIAVLVGASSSSFCALCTRSLNENEAPLWDFGTGYPLGAGLIAFYGFAVAAMWIDIFASEIVGFLHFFGLLAGVHPAVLGVTVLAWGNSLTDFVANTSMAGRSAGGTSMAMTACFAGPLFNMLVGLGIGFWAYLADTKQKSTPVKFDSVVLVGCVFSMLNCAGVIATAVRNKHRLPGQFGWVMCGWYLLYMLVVLMMSIH